MRENLVRGAIDYFRSEQWTDFMSNHLLRQTGGEVYHIHIYTDTCIHPESLSELITRYFDAINRPLLRRTDPTANRPDVAAVHSIHPLGCPHFEVIFRYNENEALCAMPPEAPESEHGHNLLSWDRECMNDILTKIPFQVVGPREDEEIKEYFMSRFWKAALEGIVNPNYGHFHVNLEINFDPKILELYVRQEFAKIGWTIDKIVPAIFDMKSLTRLKITDENDKRNNYVGKLNFNLSHPHVMFDIAWMFNPDVTIRPAQEGWIFGTKYFDAWPMGNYDKFIAANDYKKLTEEELDAISASFYEDNPYVRK